MLRTSCFPGRSRSPAHGQVSNSDMIPVLLPSSNPKTHYDPVCLSRECWPMQKSYALSKSPVRVLSSLDKVSAVELGHLPDPADAFLVTDGSAVVD